jgi:hypothetical protein
MIKKPKQIKEFKNDGDYVMHLPTKKIGRVQSYDNDKQIANVIFGLTQWNLYKSHDLLPAISKSYNELVIVNKPRYYKVKSQTQQKDSYDKWYERSMSNGDFAYNGVADDF